MTYLGRLITDSQNWQSVLVYVGLLMCHIYCILTYGICRVERKQLVNSVITTKMVHFCMAHGGKSMLSLSLRIASV